MKKIILLITLITILFSFGCDTVFEDDLSKETIEIVMPKDSLVSDNLTVQFWWKFGYTCSYQLEIVSPSFSNPINVCLDTNLETNKFLWNFKPGKYQWRIKASNNTSSTEYQYYNFSIDSTMDMSNIQMVLLSPASDEYLNFKVLHFNWLNIYNAEKYYFSLYDANQNIILFDKETTLNNFNVPGTSNSDTLIEGKYKWGIRAANQLSSSNYSYKYFTIDRTSPTSPVLLFPSNNVQVPDSNIHFKWSSGQDLVASLPFDSLFVAPDSSFTQLLVKKRITTELYTDSLGTGTYWWHVKSYDKAGNNSKSNLYKLIVN